MFHNPYLSYPYLLAALSLLVFVLTGLIIHKRQQRRAELKTIAQSFLAAPLVLQGVWLVILLAHIMLHLPFYYMDWLGAGSEALPLGLVLTLLAGLLLLGTNMLLRRLAQSAQSPFYRRCWQLLGFALGCCLLANLVLNYFWHGWEQRNIAPWPDYGNLAVTGTLLLVGVVLWLLAPRWAGRQRDRNA